MDPNSGRLYESVQAAKDDGVLDAIEIRASREIAERLSAAMKAFNEKENKQ